MTVRNNSKTYTIVSMLVALSLVFFSATMMAQNTISPTTVTLDTISTAGPINMNFIFSNNGDFPVVIQKVEVPSAGFSCNYTKSSIKPGEKSDITVELNTQDLRPGNIDKLIKVKTTGKPASFNLRIKGYVSDKIPAKQLRKDGIDWTRTYSNGKYGAEINSSTIIPPSYESLVYNRVLEEFLGKKGATVIVFGKAGDEMFKFECDEYTTDNKGFVIKKNSIIGYIDKFGNVKIPLSSGYKSINHVFNGPGEHFVYNTDKSVGVLDKNGNIVFELPKFSDISRVVVPYYKDNKPLFISNDGIYDINKNRVLTFNNIIPYPMYLPFITEDGMINQLEIDVNNPDTPSTRTIGSIHDLRVAPSSNPFE